MKYLLLIISYFVRMGRRRNTGEPPVGLQMIKNTLQKEASLIIYKALFGLLLVSLIILCLNQTIKASLVIINQFEYGYVFGFFFFTIIALVGLYFLQRLFNMSLRKLNQLSSAEAQAPPSINFKEIKSNFVHGFIEGLETKRKGTPSSIEKES